VTHPVSILLPGLDGTGDLFEHFVAAAPPAFPVRVQRLPSDRPRGYRDLADAVLPLLPVEPFALVAESFSGPLAVLLANRCPQACAVVLCATFIRPPLSKLLARVPGFNWGSPPPRLLLQHLMAGGDPRLADAVRDAVAPLDSATLRTRIAAVLTVDVTRELERLTQPLLYLRARRDRLVPARCSSAVRAAKASAQIVSVDGPHLILQARPDEAWLEIAPFLERAFLRATR
jgi:sigma-B regulation protein RsbQ